MRKRKTGLKYFFLSFWNISMFFQLLLPLPKLGFKIDLPYCTAVNSEGKSVAITSPTLLAVLPEA